MARDGVRYLYPALFPTCLLAAAGVDAIAATLGKILRRPAVMAPAMGVLGTALGLYVLHASLNLHPYYIDYYNELVGGPQQVEKHRWFEIGWWGEGLDRAADFISRNAPHGARVKVFAHPAHVIQLRDDLEIVRDINADYVIFNKLFNDSIKLPRHRTAYVVRAAGAPLVWVYQREPDRP
jgi:hypothetical protein